MKKIKLFKNICVFLCVLSTVLAFSGCAKKGELIFNQNLTADINEEYKPNVSVKNGSIVSITLRNDDGEMIELNEDYSFTPQGFGKYHYFIVVNMDKQIKELVKTVTVGDFVAPEVVEVPTSPKTVEVGGYFDFAQDLENIIVTDNDVASLEKITKKVVKVSGGEKVQENANGFTDVLLSKAGEYTVTVEIKDVSGNVSYAQYKLNAVDTTSPIINSLTTVYGWLDDGKILVPEVDVVDVSVVSTTVTATLGGTVIDIEDGYISAQVGDEIALTYTAKDEYENSSIKTVTLKVLPYGELFDSTDKTAVEYFTADSGVVEFSGGISFVSDQAVDSLTWKDGSFSFGSIKEFSGLSLTAINHGYSQVNVTINAKVGYERVSVGGFTLNQRQSEVFENTFIIDLTKSGLDNIDGFELSFTSDDALSVTLTQASLTTFANPYVTVATPESIAIGELLNYTVTQNGQEIYESTITVANGGQVIETVPLNKDYYFETVGDYLLTFSFDLGNVVYTVTKNITVTAGTPTDNQDQVVEQANQITFETDTSFDFAGVYEGGLTKAVGGNFTINGKTSAKAVIDGNSYVGVVWSTPYVLTGEVNYATLNIYANLDGVIKVGFITDNSSEVIFGRNINLTKGANQVGFLLGNTVNDKWLGVGVKALLVYNQSSYENICYIDDITFTDKQIVTELELFKSNLTTVYGVVKNVISIPDVIACDSKFIESASVSINNKDNNQKLLEDLSIGERIDLSTLGVGEYQIKYLVTALGGNYEKTIDLTIVEKAIEGEIDFTENYYVGVEFELPDAKITSKIFTENELENATVTKYYRAEKGLEWLDGNDTITKSIAGAIEVKYVVRVGEEVIVLTAKTYVHTAGVHADYEPWCDGDNYGYYSGFGEGNIISLSKDWAYDGEYSLKIHANDQWERKLSANSPGVIARQTNLDAISFGYQADAFVVWVYSEYDFRDVTIQFDNNDDKWVSGTLQIKKGVNKQIVTLDKTISAYKRIRFEVHGNEPYYIDSLSFVQLANISVPEIDGKQYDQGVGVAIEQPTFIPNPEFFTPEEIELATVKIQYEDINGVHEDILSGNGTTLTLGAGDYDVTFIFTVGKVTFTYVQNITVRKFECEFVEPFSLVKLNEEITLTIVNSLSENATIVASIRKVGGEWSSLTVTDGKATINLTDAGDYEIKYVATQGELIEEEIYNLLVRKPNSIADFEINPDGSHVVVGGTVNTKQGNITTDWSKDGKYSYRIKAVGDDFAWVRYMDSNLYSDAGGWQTVGQIDFDEPKNAISMWINAEWEMKDFAWEVLTRNEKGTLYWAKSNSQTVYQGEHKYIFTFENSFTFMYAFGCLTGTNKAFSQFYVDAVEVLNVNANLPTMSTSTVVGQEYVVEKPTFTVVGTEIESIKAYLILGETETLLTEDNGYYKFVIETADLVTVKIRYEITDIDGAVVFVTAKQVVTARAFKCEFIEPTLLVKANVDTEYALVSSVEDGVVLTAQIRKVGGEWSSLTVTDGKVTINLTDAGEYEIKYVATLNGVSEEETYLLLVRTTHSIADFEINPDGKHVLVGGKVNEGQGYISTDWSKDGKYSYRIVGSGDDFAWVRYMDSNLYSDAGGWQTVGQIDFDEPKNAISIWINADWQMENFSFEVLTRNEKGTLYWVKSNSQTIYQGEHKYIFTFENSFTFMYAFGCLTGTKANYKNFYIDAVEVLKIDIGNEIPERAIVGNTITFDTPTFNTVGATVDSVSVAIVNGTQLTDLVADNGRYAFTVEELKDITLRVTLTDIDGAVAYYDITVKVYEKEDDGFAEDIEWQQSLI